MLTDAENGDDTATASEFGVVGQFPSTCGAAVLIAAIRLALAGGRFQNSCPNGGRGRLAPQSWRDAMTESVGGATAVPATQLKVCVRFFSALGDANVGAAFETHRRPFASDPKRRNIGVRERA